MNYAILGKTMNEKDLDVTMDADCMEATLVKIKSSVRYQRVRRFLKVSPRRRRCPLLPQESSRMSLHSWLMSRSPAKTDTATGQNSLPLHHNKIT